MFTFIPERSFLPLADNTASRYQAEKRMMMIFFRVSLSFNQHSTFQHRKAPLFLTRAFHDRSENISTEPASSWQLCVYIKRLHGMRNTGY